MDGKTVTVWQVVSHYKSMSQMLVELDMKHFFPRAS